MTIAILTTWQNIPKIAEKSFSKEFFFILNKILMRKKILNKIQLNFEIFFLPLLLNLTVNNFILNILLLNSYYFIANYIKKLYIKHHSTTTQSTHSHFTRSMSHKVCNEWKKNPSAWYEKKIQPSKMIWKPLKEVFYYVSHFILNKKKSLFHSCVLHIRYSIWILIS